MVKGVGIDIGSALNLYIFVCLCTTAQGDRGTLILDFAEDCELGLESVI